MPVSTMACTICRAECERRCSTRYTGDRSQPFLNSSDLNLTFLRAEDAAVLVPAQLYTIVIVDSDVEGNRRCYRHFRHAGIST